MPSVFVAKWIDHVEKCITFWTVNLPLYPGLFSVTPLPGVPVLNVDVLSHNITSCCAHLAPSPYAISFDHVPEPYYGNPDDSIEKSAVVLFYNPGPQGGDQLHIALNPAAFLHGNYLGVFAGSYYNLSAANGFCFGTINRFINPKTNQLNAMLAFIPTINHLRPLLMDMVPWHSPQFSGLNALRFINPHTLNEAWENVLMPAILNARNTAVTHYGNSLKKRKIILFAIGAKYSRDGWLSTLGFTDVTGLIPPLPPHVHIIPSPGALIGFDFTTPNGRGKIWEIDISDLIKRLPKTDTYNETILDLKNFETITLINIWTQNIGMNILGGGSMVAMNHILNNL